MEDMEIAFTIVIKEEEVKGKTAGDIMRIITAKLEIAKYSLLDKLEEINYFHNPINSGN